MRGLKRGLKKGMEGVFEREFFERSRQSNEREEIKKTKKRKHENQKFRLMLNKNYDIL